MIDCPFCKPEINNSVFAESENFLAIYNIAPVFPGHSLIIPKKHVESILSLTENETIELMLFARKLTQFLLHIFKSDGFNWSVQDKEAAGQSVAHLHMHIVPRLNGDLANPGDWYPLIQNNSQVILDSEYREKIDPQKMESIVNFLKKSIGKIK
jgi:bis(5'-adenosyl)-triphosphatase